MKHSEQINELALALVKAKQGFKPAVKNSTNPHFKSRYLDLEGAIEASEPSLLANGLVAIQGVQGSISEQSVTVNTRLLHTSGQWIEDSLTLPAVNRSNFDPQAVGSAISYARRYSLMAMLGFAAADDDGNAATEQEKVDKPLVQRSTFQQQVKASVEAEQDQDASIDDIFGDLLENKAMDTSKEAYKKAYSKPVEPSAKGKDGFISAGQVKRLWAISKSKNLAPEAVMTIIGAYGFEKPEEIHWKQYNEIIGKIEA